MHFQNSARLILELKAATKNLEAMKKQAESTNTEYDRLMKEHSQLQVCCQLLIPTFFF